MYRLGEKQILEVVKITEHGAFLKESGENDPSLKEEKDVLLPGNQLKGDEKEKDNLTVFLYKDSEDRLVATLKEPKLKLHEVGFLKVAAMTKNGAFLDWGLDKDLLLPFHEQPRDERVKEGQTVLVAVYIDKSNRLAATMNVYPYLQKNSPYKAGDRVTGTVYETSENFGTFVAVDNCYSALIPKKELVRNLKIGESVEARVTRVKTDGKLDLSLREKAAFQLNIDTDRLGALLEEKGGILPFTDKADPEKIRTETGMSKNEFKRAVGHLLKEGKIKILPDAIVLVGKES